MLQKQTLRPIRRRRYVQSFETPKPLYLRLHWIKRQVYELGNSRFPYGVY